MQIKIGDLSDSKITESSHKKLINAINNNKLAKVGIYECYSDETTEFVHPFFDIDLKDDEDDFDRYFENPTELLNLSKTIIQDELNVKNISFSVSQANTEHKISFHIVVDNYKVNYKLFRYWMLDHKDVFEPLHFDFSIYCRKFQFRVVKTEKNIKDKHSPALQPINNRSDKFIHKHFVTYITKGTKLIKLDVKINEIEAKIQEKKQFVKSSNLADTILGIVEHLNPKRADSYNDWFPVVCAIINSIGSKTNKAIEIVHKFSSLSSKYDKIKVDNFMNSLQVQLGGYKFGSLMLWLQKDDMNYYDTIKSQNSYEVVKETFELNNFKVLHPSPMYVTRTPYDKFNKICINRQSEFKIMYEDLYYTEKVGNEKDAKYASFPFISRWLSDPNKKVYDKMEFDPNPNFSNSNIFNLFDGFYASKIMGCKYNKEYVDKINELIYYLTGCHEESKKFFIKWMAHGVQKPHLKCECPIAPLFKSEEGTGKSTIINFYGSILGRTMFLYCNDAGKLLNSDFNGQLMGQLLCNFDETSGKDTFEKADKLKSLISQDELVINEKYMKAFKMNDFTRYIFSTNNLQPVKLTSSNRRYFVNECSTKFKGNSKYWTEMFKILNSDEAIYSYFTY